MDGSADDYLIPEADKPDHEDRAVTDPSKFLSPPRRERAVMNLFAGMSMKQAYEDAGFLSRDNASAFFHNPDVAARILYLERERHEEERQAKARARCAVIYEDALAMSEAEEVRIMAMRLGRPGAALGAVVLKARLSGLLKEEADGLGVPMGEMTLEQVERYRVDFGRRLQTVRDAIAERIAGGTEEPGGVLPGNPQRVHH